MIAANAPIVAQPVLKAMIGEIPEHFELKAKKNHLKERKVAKTTMNRSPYG